MRITISGEIGSGKTTVARLLAERLGYRYYSVGDFMRAMAGERKMTLLELSSLAEKDRSIDRELDKRQEALSSQDNLVLDSRLGFHFVKNCYKVYLTVEISEAAKRVFTDSRSLEKENTTMEATLGAIKRRRDSERKRYRKYYGVDPSDIRNYDLIVDTTRTGPKEAVSKILGSLPKG